MWVLFKILEQEVHFSEVQVKLGVVHVLTVLFCAHTFL